MRRKIAIALVIGVLIVGGYSQIGVADDDWPDKCRNANSISPGDYEGTLSPKDRDVFVLPIKSGDHVSVRMDFESQNQETKIAMFGLNQDAINKARKYDQETKEFQEYFERYGRPEYVYRHYKDLSITGDLLEGPQSDGDYHAKAAYQDNSDYVEEGIDYAVYDEESGLGHIIDEKLAPQGTTNFRVYAETNSSVCLVLQTANRETPGNWNIDMAKNQGIETTTKTTPTATTTTSTTITQTPTTTSSITTSTSATDSTITSSQSTIQDSDGDGVIDSEDYAPEDPEVQEKADLQSDTQTPGFGFGAVGMAIIASILLIKGNL